MADYHSKKAWYFYSNWFELFDDLSDEDVGKLVRAIGVFARTGNTPKLTGELKGIFRVIKSQIETDGKAWEKSCEKRAEAGRKGMSSRWNSDNKNNKNNNSYHDYNNNKNNREDKTSKEKEGEEKKSNEKLTSLLSSSAPQQVPSEKELLLAEYYDYRNNWDVCDGICPSWEDWKKQREVENV